MPVLQSAQDTHQSPATPAEVTSILGNLDATQMLAILALQPTVADIEQARMWLAGDLDVFGATPPLHDIAGEIVAILTADEEDERREAR